jgi:hypothetical protein
VLATDAHLSNRNLPSSTWCKVINVNLFSRKEFNLLAKDKLIIRKKFVVALHVEIFSSEHVVGERRRLQAHSSRLL